ncbi:hypothetical protein FE374_09375 [Georgenia yuyongxinii]|uniref:Phage tail protein n=1 Tax=Georgenia yuyongxinii TaxID=2589797 RepID=A0A5B8C636_9MICO|nr:hypothetical protein [Georgenia yuyongxinii]QDC24795.1 hypothetical protein FE374_09375 [Georgenia yuyongxinii]
MGSTRIKGNKLALKFGSPAEDFWADATSVVLENEETSGDGVITFENAAQVDDSRQWFFTLSAIQSTAATSFWRYLWDNTGETVAFTYAPHGNADPTDSEPHFIGTCKIGPKPSVGGEASATGEYTFETRLDVVTGPTLDVGGA